MSRGASSDDRPRNLPSPPIPTVAHVETGRPAHGRLVVEGPPARLRGRSGADLPHLPARAARRLPGQGPILAFRRLSMDTTGTRGSAAQRRRTLRDGLPARDATLRRGTHLTQLRGQTKRHSAPRGTRTRSGQALGPSTPRRSPAEPPAMHGGRVGVSRETARSRPTFLSTTWRLSHHDSEWKTVPSLALPHLASLSGWDRSGLPAVRQAEHPVLA